MKLHNPDPINLDRISPEAISTCSQRHIQSVLEDNIEMLKAAKLVLLRASPDILADDLARELLEKLGAKMLYCCDGSSCNCFGKPYDVEES